MIYQLYQAQSDFMAPIRGMARIANAMFSRPTPGFAEEGPLRSFAAASELIARAGLTHVRPPFGIASVRVGDKEVAVTEEVTLRTPFATLLHFKKDVAVPQPRVLIVAPMSGHFATLLRATVRTMLAEHDIYITDWHNARDVAVSEGPFGVDDYIDHVVLFLQTIGPGAHVLAVCQPCVPVLAAVALMAEAGNEAQPRSMTLMAGPIDARLSPTKVNELALSKPIEWFERNLIDTVPYGYPGSTRRVYPGFVQLAAFMSMNMDRHVKAHRDLYENTINGNRAKAEATRAFYDEYFAVLDLPAEFYLETVRTVFQEHVLPLGKFTYRGQPVSPGVIRRTALLTVEGERDDICGIGQTLAAQDLCTGIRPAQKHHHLQPGVGHYGVFSGARWNNQIYPVVKQTILASD
ncbi:MAG TPA: polyhydroxyalkanoate depolymerase [Candidatus Acidoferrales bacterium]|nr:polyhydroxyalkanoate depolymerase [Candidatus Acidoferrales bacterium]